MEILPFFPKHPNSKVPASCGFEQVQRILRLESFRLAVGLGLWVVGLGRFIGQKRPS